MFPFPPLTCEETTTCGMLLLLLVTMTANKAFLKLGDNAACVLSKTSSFEDEQGGSSNSALVHSAVSIMRVAIIIFAAAVLAFTTKWLVQWYGFDQRDHNNVATATKLIARMESSTSKQYHQEESVGEPLQPETQQEVSIPDKIPFASSSVPIAMEKETKYKHDSFQEDDDDFIVHPETWGFALDDSKIQRKMLERILQEAGVPTSRIVVMGKTAADVDTFSTRLLSQIPQQQYHDTNTKFLVLVDEILDYSGADATQESTSSSCIYSGSLTVQKILSQLTQQQQGRVLALVRSANDTQHDIERCMQRGMHGFISKCHHGHDQVREIVTELWRDRFLLSQLEKQQQKQEEEDALEEASADEMKSTLDHDDDDYLLVSREELLDSLSLVERVAQDWSWNNSSINVNDINWPRFWSALHTLKGDVSMVQGVHDLDVAVELIHGLRGSQPPADLSSKWSEIQRRVHSGAQCLKMQ